MIGIGIVGCGIIADIHAQAIRQLSNGQLISVFSRNEENARKLGNKYNVEFHTDWDQFIENDRLKMVSICTPSGTHLDYGLKAARAGKHIVVEKPIEVTVERGRKLVDTCIESDVYLAVIFQNRYLDGVMKAKKMLSRGDMGEIFHADAHIKWYRTQEYYDSAAWRGTFALDGGGVLINQAIHTIDLLRYLVGDINYIFGQIGTYTHEGIEGEDDAVAAIRFKNGAVGTIVASTSIIPARNRLIEIHGKAGTMILDGDDVFINGKYVEDNKKKEKRSSGADSPLQGFSPEPHRRQFEEIIQMIHRNSQPNICGEDSLRTLAVIQAIYESSRRMIPIKLD